MFGGLFFLLNFLKINSLVLILTSALSMKIFLMTKHILNLLLLLESIMLSVIMMFTFFSVLPANYIMIFFTLAVCEACVGLSLFINFMRNFGSDFMYL